MTLLNVWWILKEALFVLLAAMCLSDMMRKDKANLSRLLFVAILIIA